MSGGIVWFKPIEASEELILIAILAGVCAAILNCGLIRFASRASFSPIESGVLSTIPCAIIPASIAFVILDPDVEVVEALYAVPTGILLNAFFLTVWKTLPPCLAHCKRVNFSSLLPLLLFSICASVIVWTVAFLCLFFSLHPLELNFQRAAAGCSSVFMLVFGVILAKRQSFPSHNQCNINGRSLYVLLGALSFIATTTAVFVSVSNEVAAGLICTFPCTFMISMVSHWTFQATPSRGKELITTSISRLYIAHMVLGSLSVSGYCILFATFYELDVIHGNDVELPIGITLACGASWTIAFLFISVPIILILRWVQFQSERRIPGSVILPSSMERIPLITE